MGSAKTEVFCQMSARGDTHLAGLESLGTLTDIELDGLTFDQCAKAISFDCGIVHENVFPTLLRDEAKTLQVIEPLHLSGLAQRSTSYCYRNASTSS